jgi:hypothetical protein
MMNLVITWQNWVFFIPPFWNLGNFCHFDVIPIVNHIILTIFGKSGELLPSLGCVVSCE